MSGIATAVVGGAVISSYAQGKAADKAAGAQVAAGEAGVEQTKLGIEEQKRQFDKVLQLLQPYVSAGRGSILEQQDLAGSRGPVYEQIAIDKILQGPEYQSLTNQGEEAILANASATGGLRGGNVQEALAKYRPQILSDLINQRFQRLGQISTLGQASAAGSAAAAQNYGSAVQGGYQNIASQYGNIGAAQAGAALGQGQAIGGIGNAIGTLGVLKGLKVF